MAEVLTIGEPMGLFIAEEAKPLKDVQQFTRRVCGAEVNFSIGLARLGHEVAYVSRVGADPLGEHIIDFLKENHIDTAYVTEDDEHLTGMQMKAKTEDGSDPMVVNYRKHTAFSYFVQQSLQNINWQGVRHVHATGIPAALSESCCQALAKLMEEAHAHGCTVSFDPNLRPALWPSQEIMVDTLNRLAAKADLILPGIGEGRTLTGCSEPEQIADFYLQRGAQAVVVKLGGSKGAYTKEKSGKYFFAPSFAVEHVVDTVGAGDGFAVGIISALLEGLSLPEAVRRGTAIGALAVMSPGDNEGLPNRQKLQHFMEVA
ncbi:sugar kinase [Selenomonas ruminantium]|uniref:Sugar kinase n=1 Tax=Selenomonas ruminantium TaxID=971 RepID=A0A927WL45_SELRU|nr:sugar kinase [Selenomonas ruminantium]MBE6091860.1 sugar kinase [Selenomonas ruminantium]